MLDTAQQEEAACQDVNEEDSRVVILFRELGSIQDMLPQHDQIVVVAIREINNLRSNW